MMSTLPPAHHSVPVAHEGCTLIAAGLPIVRDLARSLARRVPSHIDCAELASAGALGLMHAVRSFDATRPEKFGAYASFRIRGAMLDELRALDPISRHARRRAKALQAAASRLEALHGRPADREELSAVTGMDTAACAAYAETSATWSGLLRAGETDPDQLPADTPDPASLYAERELGASLARAIASLPERTQRMLAMYFEEERSQAEIAEAFGVTESRVCQILKAAAATLRERLGAH